MKQGPSIVATDCKGAVVANKLQAGTLRPRGRHSRIEARICATMGNTQVQWMRATSPPSRQSKPPLMQATMLAMRRRTL
eukprot:6451299-Amphidinium_carterae.1